MDIAARLKLLEARKRASSALIEEARAGLVPLVGLASESLREPVPKPPESPPATLADFTEEKGPLGTILRRAIACLPDDADPIVPRIRVAGSDAEAGIPLLLAPTSSVPVTRREIVFLDTETTGISGGAGTIAFIVGLAWFGEDGHPRLEQMLIRDFCDEAELIRRVAERLGQFKAVAHYNGRTFDMPILRSRGIIHRMRPREFQMPELDLLHPSRRLWRAHLGNATLKSVEKGVLAIDRGRDVDGAEIPAVFHEFSRGVGEARMAEVARHNAQDVISLTGVLDLACAIHGNPLGTAPSRLSEVEGMARWFAGRRNCVLVAGMLDRALLMTTTRADENRLRLALAAALRSCGEHQRAIAHWGMLLDAEHAVALEATVALAKMHEHTGRNPGGALDVLRRFLRRLELEADIESMLGREGNATHVHQNARLEFSKRMERLTEKVRRAARHRP